MKIADIQKIVCDECDISLTQIVSRSRRRDWSWPRHVAMGLAREFMPEKTLAQIAIAFKRVNHTTVLHAIEHFERMKEEDGWKKKIKAAREKCLIQ